VDSFSSNLVERAHVGVVDVHKQKAPNLLETLTWEEFKLQLDRRFTSYHLVLWDGMKLLEPTQGDNKGSLAAYVQDFN
jgi:hypothetical protein